MGAPSIFLSYVRENNDIVERIRRDLSDIGAVVWRDRESIYASENWRRSIARGIRNADVFAVIVSKELVSRSKTVVLDECRQAARNNTVIGSIIRILSLERLRSARLVQLVIDETNNQKITEYFSMHEIGIFNQYNSVDLFHDYDAGLARLIGAINIAHFKVQKSARKQVPQSTINGWLIEHLPRYQIFEPPVMEHEIVTTMTQSRPLPEPLSTYYHGNLQKAIKSLQDAGRAVTINNGYGARQIIFDKEHAVGTKGRTHKPRIVFEETDYSYQLMFSERMDSAETLDVSGKSYSIREYLELFKGMDFANFSWETMQQIPFPQRFANVVCLLVRPGDGGSEGLDWWWEFGRANRPCEIQPRKIPLFSVRYPAQKGCFALMTLCQIAPMGLHRQSGLLVER